MSDLKQKVTLTMIHHVQFCLHYVGCANQFPKHYVTPKNDYIFYSTTANFLAD